MLNFKKTPNKLITALALSIACSTSAYAFSDDEARRAILELREQVQRMAEQDRNVRLEFADQLEMLKQEVMTLRGKVEQLKWASGLSNNTNQDGSQSTLRAADPQEQAAFEGPDALFRSGKYAEASDGFKTFIEAYPDSILTPEARFYRGSSLYATKQFRQSITALKELIDATPEDPKAPDALLIIAASQIELDDFNGAKASLQRITKDYPNTSAAKTAAERLKLL